VIKLFVVINKDHHYIEGGALMNYLQEIVAFNRWKEVNQIPATAIALWHELMSINNKCGWKKEFTVPNGVLQSYAGLSRKQLNHARNILIQNNLITYKKSSRVNQAGKYSIISIVQKGIQEGTQEGTQKGTQKEHEKGHERGTLIKHKLKHNKKDLSYARVIKLSQEYFMILSPKQQMILESYYEDLGEKLVTEAMKRSHLENKGFDYAAGILKNWYQKGVRNLEDVKRDDEQFERIKHQKEKREKKAATGAYSHIF
jgi:DnaD/phage-associated family protein